MHNIDLFSIVIAAFFIIAAKKVSFMDYTEEAIALNLNKELIKGSEWTTRLLDHSDDSEIINNASCDY